MNAPITKCDFCGFKRDGWGYRDWQRKEAKDEDTTWRTFRRPTKAAPENRLRDPEALSWDQLVPFDYWNDVKKVEYQEGLPEGVPMTISLLDKVLYIDTSHEWWINADEQEKAFAAEHERWHLKESPITQETSETFVTIAKERFDLPESQAQWLLDWIFNFDVNARLVKIRGKDYEDFLISLDEFLFNHSMPELSEADAMLLKAASYIPDSILQMTDDEKRISEIARSPASTMERIEKVVEILRENECMGSGEGCTCGISNPLSSTNSIKMSRAAPDRVMRRPERKQPQLNQESAMLSLRGFQGDAAISEDSVVLDALSNEEKKDFINALRVMAQPAGKGNTAPQFASMPINKVAQIARAMNVHKSIKGTLEGASSAKRYWMISGEPFATKRMITAEEILDSISPLDVFLWKTTYGLYLPYVYGRRMEEAGGDILVVRDCSASILEGAKSDFMNHAVVGVVNMAKEKNLKVSYLVFNNNPTSVVKDACKEYGKIMIAEQGIYNTGGTSFDTVFKYILETYKNTENLNIVFLSDGEDDYPAAEIERIKLKGWRLITVFTGGGGSNVLKRMAEETEGAYYEVKPTKEGALEVIQELKGKGPEYSD
ncbi:MAG: vWA domain-containing protein [Candidatus Bathyarchaeia archaeon]